jgi:hypothetical protein
MRILPLLLVLAAPASAAAPKTNIRIGYDVYAHGLQVASFDANYDIAEGGYSVAVAYRTTGLIGAMFGGHQLSVAQGAWQGTRALPLHVSGDGFWRGEPHKLEIDYEHGDPVIRDLEPPNEPEREPVPPELQARTIDSLSAMMLLVRNVAETGRCDADVTTFDGRRAVRVTARTIGPEALEPTSRSTFAGPTMRCDFEGTLLAGGLRDDQAAAKRPKHGSAWFAPAVAGQPPVPVRVTFETSWFGDATMYVTKATAQGDGVAAR